MKVSECCGANIIHHDICIECGEHCLAVSEDNELKGKNNAKKR